MDKGSTNLAIQPAVRAQLAPSKRKKTVVPVTEDLESQVPASSKQNNKKPDKPPRLLWFEQQATKLERLEYFEEEAMMEVEDDGDWEDVDSVCDEEEQFKNKSRAGKLSEDSPAGSIPITDCLFCSHHSRSLLKNIDHMTKTHRFFIHDIEYFVDLKGLMKYLGSYPDHKDGEDIEMKAADVPTKNLEYNEETMELVFPSGARIGHRSLLRYCKQHFGISRAVATTGTCTLGRVLQQCEALGWSSELAASQRKERDMQYVQRMKSQVDVEDSIVQQCYKADAFQTSIPILAIASRHNVQVT